MTRLDPTGRDVTDSPGLWSESDCEIAATNHASPDITTGQHTNGPAMLFIRRADGGPWVRTGLTKMHLLRAIWETCGEECFEEWS